MTESDKIQALANQRLKLEMCRKTKQRAEFFSKNALIQICIGGIIPLLSLQLT